MKLIHKMGNIVAASGGDDPVRGQFLDFPACDISNHPERMQAIDAGFAKHIKEAPVRPRYRLADLMAEMPQGMPRVEGWDEMPTVGLE